METLQGDIANVCQDGWEPSQRLQGVKWAFSSFVGEYNFQREEKKLPRAVSEDDLVLEVPILSCRRLGWND